MRLVEFSTGGGNNGFAYLLLNYDFDNNDIVQAFVSVCITDISDRDFQIINQSIEDQHPGYEELGRDLSLFDDEDDNISHVTADSISRDQFSDKMYGRPVKLGPTIDRQWFSMAAGLPLD